MLNVEQDWCRQILLLGTILLSRDESEADKNFLLGEESSEITSLAVILKKSYYKPPRTDIIRLTLCAC